MRWKLKPCPAFGAMKTIKRFLWFPTFLYDEWRWLETAVCMYEFTRIPGEIGGFWQLVAWDAAVGEIPSTPNSNDLP